MGTCGGAGGKGVNNEQAKGKGKGSGESQPSGRGFGSSAWGAGGYGGFRNEQGSSLQKETLAQLIKNNRGFEKMFGVLAVIAMGSPSTRPKQEPRALKTRGLAFTARRRSVSRPGRSATSAGSRGFQIHRGWAPKLLLRSRR